LAGGGCLSESNVGFAKKCSGRIGGEKAQEVFELIFSKKNAIDGGFSAIGKI
jgi:hypothetical protein